MALSGSVKTSGYQGRYVQLDWTAKQDVASNTSTISWTLKGGGSATHDWYRAGPFEITINGVTTTIAATNPRLQLWNGTTVKTGTAVITHDSNGKKSFTISLKAAIYAAAYNCSGSGTFTLNDIPRAATITAAPNFYDTDNPTITYNNAAGNTVTTLQACISLTGATDDIKYRDISKTGTSYTFSLTEAEREVLRKACTTANNRTVTFFIKTVIGGNTLYSTLSKTLTIKDGSLTLSPTVVDTNEKTIALTGDANKLIKYYSTATFNNGETARKHATIIERNVINGANAANTATGSFSAVESNTFEFTAKDSRGNSLAKTITKDIVNYIKLTCNMDAKAELADDNTTTITLDVSGKVFIGSFGAKANKMYLWYRLKAEGEEYGDWVSVDFTLNNNAYTADVEIKGLDYRKAYTVQAIAQDDMFLAYGNYATSAERTVKTVPVANWNGKSFNFNVPMFYKNNPMDFVIETGEKNGWTYRKWYSGVCECWKILTHTTKINSVWGSLYIGTPTSRQSYPFPYKTKPVEIVNLLTGGSSGFLFTDTGGNGVNGAYASACYNVARGAVSNNDEVLYLSFYIIGELP
jgi:hypothetical protein